MPLLKKDDTFYTESGDLVIVTSVNNDGTVTAHHVAGSGKSGYAGKFPNREMRSVSLSDADFDNLDSDEVESVSIDSYEESTKVPTLQFDFEPKEKRLVEFSVSEFRRESQEMLANSHSGVEQLMLQSNIHYAEDVLTKIANTEGALDFDAIETQIVKVSVQRHAERMRRSAEGAPDYPIKDDMFAEADRIEALVQKIEAVEEANAPKYYFDDNLTDI